MSKKNKITKEELENLQGIVGRLNSASNQLGNIEMQNTNYYMLHKNFRVICKVYKKHLRKFMDK